MPETPLSAGSFTVSSTGSAVKMTCVKLVEKLAEMAVADPASPLHGTDPKAIRAEDSTLIAGDKRESFAEIVKRSGMKELVVEHKTMPSKERDNYSMHSFGAVFVEVRVDEELGRVRVTRVVGAWAGGKILNAKTARSQLIGGVVWSIGMALEEEAVRDPKTGRVITRDLADYHVPVHADVPDIDITFVAETDPHVNEVGAKGLGEIGNTGASAAIANAVFHATGKRVRDLPIRLDKLLPEERA
jgi:xanthine dehydrogenase YagR molybdenum-binding subunit